MFENSPSLFYAVTETEVVGGGPATLDTAKATETALNEATMALNARWRVRDDGRLQWHLEYVKPNGKWIGRRFHVERDPLLRSIRELCGEVDQAAIATVEGWPRLYVNR